MLDAIRATRKGAAAREDAAEFISRILGAYAAALAADEQYAKLSGQRDTAMQRRAEADAVVVRLSEAWSAAASRDVTVRGDALEAAALAVLDGADVFGAGSTDVIERELSEARARARVMGEALRIVEAKLETRRGEIAAEFTGKQVRAALVERSRAAAFALVQLARECDAIQSIVYRLDNAGLSLLTWTGFPLLGHPSDPQSRFALEVRRILQTGTVTREELVAALGGGTDAERVILGAA